MDLKKVIERQNGTMYKFALKHDLSHQRVHYWCSKDWERLNYTTREKIKNLLNK